MSRLFRAISGQRLKHLQPGPEKSQLQPIVDILQREVLELRKAQGGRNPFRAFNIDPQVVPTWYQGDRPIDLHLGTDGVTYMDLRRVARMSFVAPFWRRRINQVTARCSPQRTPNRPGYILRHVDPKAKLTPAMMKLIDDIDQRLNRVNNEVIKGGLRRNMKGGLVGSFEFDQFNMEVIEDRGRRPYAWQPVDAATIRRGKPTEEDVKAGTWGDAGYVQVVNDRVVNEWDSRHMVFMTRRPNPDIWANGYGFPEIAEALDIITDISNAKTYNSVYFRNGVHASTLLLLKASVTQTQFDDIRAELTATLKGQHNAHRLGVLQLSPGSGDLKPEDLTKLDLAYGNRDMEFSHLFGFLFRLFAASMQMDLAELGIGDPADTRPSQIGGDSSPDAAVGIAREGGLLPLIGDVEECINVNFVKRIHPEIEIALDGPEQSQQSRVTIYQQSINSYKSIDEIRGEDGLEPFNEDWSKMPLNPSVVQLFMAAQQQAAMQQQGAMGGAGGMPQGDPAQGQGAPQGQGGPAVGDGSDVDWNDPRSWTESLGKAIEKKFSEDGTERLGRPSTRQWDRSSGKFIPMTLGGRRIVAEVR